MEKYSVPLEVVRDQVPSYWPLWRIPVGLDTRGVWITSYKINPSVIPMLILTVEIVDVSLFRCTITVGAGRLLGKRLERNVLREAVLPPEAISGWVDSVNTALPEEMAHWFVLEELIND